MARQEHEGPNFLGSTADPSILLAGSMEQLVALARAISCATRLHLLQRLGADGLCLTEAAEAAGVSPSTACFHLARLVEAGLAVRRRTGRRCVYTWGPLRWSLVGVGTASSPAT
jgi:DNA-binding transcriptional ArsR family regulator